MNSTIVKNAVLCMAAVCCAQIIQPVVRGNQGNGTINWTRQVVIITGIGIPNPGLPQSAQRTAALGAARQAASKNAYETIGSICFNMSKNVGDILAKDGSTASAIAALLHNHEDQCRVRDFSGGSYEVTIEVPLSSVFAILLDSSASPSASVPSINARSDRRISGLIVDSRALGIKPAFAPRIFDEKGNVVYGPEYSSIVWATRFGIAGYAKTLEEALRRFDRIGKDPFIVKAKKVEGKNATDVVISRNDAAAVLGSSGNLKALSECRVILVIG